MSLFRTITTLAKSPQGKRLMGQASRYAKSPQGREQLAKAAQRVQAARKARRPPR